MARRPIRDKNGKIVGYSDDTGAGKQKSRNVTTDANRKPKREPLTAQERREVRRVVTGAGRDIARAGEQASKGAERVVGQVLVQAGREENARRRRRSRLAMRDYRQTVQEAKRLGLPVPPLPDLMPEARALENLLLGLERPKPEEHKSGQERRRDAILGFLKGGIEAGLEAEKKWVVDPTVDMAKLGSRNIWLLASDPAQYWREQQARDRRYAEQGIPQIGIFPGGGPLRGVPKGKLTPAELGRRAEQQVDELLEVQRGETPAVADVLPAASKARKKQEAGYKVERGKRFGESEAAFGQAGGGLAGHLAAKGELKGALPKVDFGKLREGGYSPRELDRDINKIYEHPDLRQGDKLHAADALKNMALHDVTPQKSQIKLLGQVFGDDEAAKLVARSLGDMTQDVLGVSRSLMTTLDLSLNMRQALPLLFRNPNIWRKSIGPQIKSLLSEGKYKQADKLLAADPDFQLALRVQPRVFTHIEGRRGLARSEYYPSPLAERIPGVKHPVRASGRAFEIGQNLGILNSFKSMLARAKKRGINIDPDTPEGLRELKGMVEVAGAQVGRGIFKTKTFRGAQPLLSQGLFAPSFYKSRLTWFSPRWYVKLPKVARYEAIRTMGQFLGGSAAILYGADKAGADVTPDPRSSDFAKVRIGDTRLDTLGGFQQWARIVAQIATGQYVDTETGEVKGQPRPFRIGPVPFGERSRFDMAVGFGTAKAAPPVSFIIDLFKGTDYQYQPFEWKRAVVNRMYPLVLQDMMTVYGETGSIPAAAAAYAAAGAGVGVQTYENRREKKAKADLKEWTKTAEAAWAKVHPGVRFPDGVRRAKRDKDAIEKLLSDIDPDDDDRERKQANALFGYVTANYPDQIPVEDVGFYQDFLSKASRAELESFIRTVRNDLYGKTLRNFNEIMPEED